MRKVAMRCNGHAMQISKQNAMRNVAMRCEKDVRNRTSARALFRVKLIVGFFFMAGSTAAAIFSPKGLPSGD